MWNGNLPPRLVPGVEMEGTPYSATLVETMVEQNCLLMMVETPVATRGAALGALAMAHVVAVSLACSADEDYWHRRCPRVQVLSSSSFRC